MIDTGRFISHLDDTRMELYREADRLDLQSLQANRHDLAYANRIKAMVLEDISRLVRMEYYTTADEMRVVAHACATFGATLEVLLECLE